jgi:hypothetical protein
LGFFVRKTRDFQGRKEPGILETTSEPNLFRWRLYDITGENNQIGLYVADTKRRKLQMQIAQYVKAHPSELNPI